MSRRTFIKQWNRIAPISGRGRGRRKKATEPDNVFDSAYRTVHDPAVEARQGGGRDGPTTRFYSASGLTSTGIPQPQDRFRAQTLSTRGGRGGRSIPQRVGMFRNAIQSNVIFGEPSERVLRHTRRKLDRLVAPESDVPESVGEWRRSPQRNTRRRRDVYEYASEDEEDDDGDEEEEERRPPLRRGSSSRRAEELRRDPDYDPFEFRDDEESTDEEYVRPAPSRPRRPSQRPALAPSTSRAAAPYERERLRVRDQRGVAVPRRLFVNEEYDMRMDDDEDEREYRRRDDRMDDEMRKGQQARGTKRGRDASPVRPVAAVVASQQLQLQQPQRRGSKRGRKEVQQPAAAAITRPAAFIREDQNELQTPSKPATDDNYTPAVAVPMARRILSGLPPMRLKEDDGSQSYLVASRSIISSALNRFLGDDEGGGDGTQPPAEAEATPEDHGQTVWRALMDRTQRISLSEESEDEDGEDEGENSREDRGDAFDNIFSTHVSPNSPVLERLFEETMREMRANEEQEEEEQVDTANMLGLSDNAGQSGMMAAMGDQFPGAPSTVVDSGSERDSISSSSSHFSRRSIISNQSMLSNRSMANNNSASALALVPAAPANFPAESDESGSTDYSSDRSSLGSMGSGQTERSFHFGMSGSTAPVNSAPNYSDPSFNFDF